MEEILKPKYKYYDEYESLDETKPGQILWAGRNYNRRNKTSHLFVIVNNQVNEEYVYGAMLSSNKDYDYKPIENKYFKENHSNGEKFEYPDKDTLFVPKKLIKFEEWAPFYLVGELTNEGLKMIKGVVENLDPEVWRWNKNVKIETEIIEQINVEVKK